MDDERPTSESRNEEVEREHLRERLRCCFRRIHLCIFPVLNEKRVPVFPCCQLLTSTPEGVKATSPMLVSGFV